MKNRVILVSILSLLGISLLAQDKINFKSVSVEAFKKAIADTNVVLVDVRTAEEFKEAHIPGTKFNIDVLEDSFSMKASELLPKASSVAIYCRSGNRSKTAARKLGNAGYKVIELDSGFKGWVEAGEKTTK